MRAISAVEQMITTPSLYEAFIPVLGSCSTPNSVEERVKPPLIAIALLAILSLTGCESEAPPALPSVRTLSRVGSESSFESSWSSPCPIESF